MQADRIALVIGANRGIGFKEGAASVLWAATIPDDGPTGEFFRDGKPLNW